MLSDTNSYSGGTRSMAARLISRHWTLSADTFGAPLSLVSTPFDGRLPSLQPPH